MLYLILSCFSCIVSKFNDLNTIIAIISCFLESEESLFSLCIVSSLTLFLKLTSIFSLRASSHSTVIEATCNDDDFFKLRLSDNCVSKKAKNIIYLM